jgi:type I restriction enzyme S subunit
MKTNWQTKKLSDVCFFQEGPGIRKYEYKKNGYPIINVRCVQDGYIDLSNAQAVDPKFIKEKWSHFQVEEGDILFTTSGTIGRTAMATKDDLPLLMNTSVVRFKSLDQKELDKYFLAWLLRSPKFIEEVKSYSSGTAQKNVGPTHLKLISISYPPISEQKRIVKILDETFEKIEKAKENAEKNLQNSKELFESYLQNVFANPGKNWEEKKLGEVCDFYNGKAHEKAIDANGAFIVINSKFISSDGEKFKKTKKALFPLFKDDIVMVMSDVPNGKALAKCFIVDKNDTYSLNQRICALRSKVFQTRFLYLQLNRNKYLLNFNNGENQTNLRKDDILNCPLFVPPISIQKDIISKLDSLSEQTKKLEEVYKKKLADLEDLKKSVLNKAFTGEL